MNGILLIILSLSPLLVNAVGSPASTYPPSNIDWNTLDTLIEIPSPRVHKIQFLLNKKVNVLFNLLFKLILYNHHHRKRKRRNEIHILYLKLIKITEKSIMKIKNMLLNVDFK